MLGIFAIFANIRRRDVRLRFVRIVSYVIPWSIFDFLWELCRRRYNKRRHGLALVSGVITHFAIKFGWLTSNWVTHGTLLKVRLDEVGLRQVG